MGDLRRKFYGFRMFIDGGTVRHGLECQPKDFA
jgi:hypothetical protein